MNKYSKLVVVLVTLILGAFQTSCLRLDSNLYNPEPVEEYKLDEYEGNTEILIDAKYDIDYSDVHLFTLQSQGPDESEATTIWAMYIGDTMRIATDTIIMYCHGNARNMDSYYQRTKLLANLGHKHRFGVMTIDYRGYGMSEGYSTEDGLYADVDEALKWLKSKGLTDDRLVIYGFSMGTAPATELTANPRSMQPSKLILEAPFASVDVMVQDAGLLANKASFFTDLKIDNAEEIKKVEEPFLWTHGTIDDFLAYDTHGEVVYKNYSGSYSRALPVEGAGHSDLPFILGYETYIEEVLKFMER